VGDARGEYAKKERSTETKQREPSKWRKGGKRGTRVALGNHSSSAKGLSITRGEKNFKKRKVRGGKKAKRGKKEWVTLGLEKKHHMTNQIWEKKAARKAGGANG